MNRRKPTSFDIAHLAGVSQATVSRALRDSDLVSPATRAKVRDIAKQLNYKVDRAASNLRTRSTQTLALLLFEDTTSDESQINPFFLSMLGSITRASAAHGYDLLVSFQQLSEDWQSYYEAAHRADGLILLGYGDYGTARPKLQALADSGAHFVLWGPVNADQPGLSVGCDNLTGGFGSASHLLSLGRKSIAFLGNADPTVAPELAARYEGYCKALKGARRAVKASLQVDAENSEASGAAAVDALLDRGVRFDALTCASDLIAIGAMNRLKARGVSVPDEVAVMGFDDIGAAAYCHPALSTMRQDTSGAGARLVELLLGELEGQEGNQSYLLEPTLVVRESCGGRRGNC